MEDDSISSSNLTVSHQKKKSLIQKQTPQPMQRIFFKYFVPLLQDMSAWEEADASEYRNI